MPYRMPHRTLFAIIVMVASIAFGPNVAIARDDGAKPSSRATHAVIETGELDGAPYRIDVPAGWNGDLVMLLHGYEPVGTPRATPMTQNEAAPVFLAQGYAVASSAYREQGWAVEAAREDNERLRAHFAARHGAPARTYVAGFSMGGLVAISTLERHGAHYDGGLSLCGVNAPSRHVFEDGVVTNLVAFDHFFPGALGLPAGGLVDPDAPPMVDPEALERALAADEAKAALLSKRLDIPREGLAGALMLNYLVLGEMRARVDGFPVDTTATVYAGFGDDAAFNAGVRRYRGDPEAMARLARIGAIDGRIDKPLVLLSSHADPSVPARFGVDHAQRAREAGRGHLVRVLPPVGRGHCDFNGSDLRAAFDALRGVGQGTPANGG
jgi:pimeloyl-ACP methyl ester carboxylesterase